MHSVDHNQILPNTDELGTALDTSPSDMSDGVQIAADFKISSGGL